MGLKLLIYVYCWLHCCACKITFSVLTTKLKCFKWHFDKVLTHNTTNCVVVMSQMFLEASIKVVLIYVTQYGTKEFSSRATIVRCLLKDNSEFNIQVFMSNRIALYSRIEHYCSQHYTQYSVLLGINIEADEEHARPCLL